MTKHLLWSLCLGLGLQACTPNLVGPEPPQMPEDQLIKLIADVHLAEALIGEKSNGPEKDSLAQSLYLQIFQSHGIDSTTFNQNMNALLQSPELSKDIADKALKYLEEDLKNIPK